MSKTCPPYSLPATELADHVHRFQPNTQRYRNTFMAANFACHSLRQPSH